MIVLNSTETRRERRMSEMTTQETNDGYVLCDCGCTVPKVQVMMGNYGTVCPNCYDEEDE